MMLPWNQEPSSHLRWTFLPPPWEVLLYQLALTYCSSEVENICFYLFGSLLHEEHPWWSTHDHFSKVYQTFMPITCWPKRSTHSIIKSQTLRAYVAENFFLDVSRLKTYPLFFNSKIEIINITSNNNKTINHIILPSIIINILMHFPIF